MAFPLVVKLNYISLEKFVDKKFSIPFALYDDYARRMMSSSMDYQDWFGAVR